MKFSKIKKKFKLKTFFIRNFILFSDKNVKSDFFLFLVSFF